MAQSPRAHLSPHLHGRAGCLCFRFRYTICLGQWHRQCTITRSCLCLSLSSDGIRLAIDAVSRALACQPVMLSERGQGARLPASLLWATKHSVTLIQPSIAVQSPAQQIDAYIARPHNAKPCRRDECRLGASPALADSSVQIDSKD